MCDSAYNVWQCVIVIVHCVMCDSVCNVWQCVMCDSAPCDVWHCVCCISCDQCWVILITLGCHAAQPANLFVELHNFDIDVIDVNQCNVAQYLTIFALIIDFCSSCQLLTLRTCGQASQFYIHSHCVWMNRFISVKAPIPEENKEKREGTNRVFFSKYCETTFNIDIKIVKP